MKESDWLWLIVAALLAYDTFNALTTKNRRAYGLVLVAACLWPVAEVLRVQLLEYPGQVATASVIAAWAAVASRAFANGTELLMRGVRGGVLGVVAATALNVYDNVAHSGSSGALLLVIVSGAVLAWLWVLVGRAVKRDMPGAVKITTMR